MYRAKNSHTDKGKRCMTCLSAAVFM